MEASGTPTHVEIHRPIILRKAAVHIRSSHHHAACKKRCLGKIVEKLLKVKMCTTTYIANVNITTKKKATVCVYLTIILFIQHTQFVRNECSASCLNPVQSVHLYEWRRRRASHECGLFLGQAGKRGVYASQGFGGLQDQNLILWTEAAAALGENEECMLNCYSVPGVFVFSQNSVVNANI